MKVLFFPWILCISLVRLEEAAFQVVSASCTLGRMLEITESSHKLSVNQNVGLISYEEFPKDEVKLIQYRSGCYVFVSGKTICLHHKIYFLAKFEMEQRVCCDPFGQYASKVKSRL